MASYLFRRPTSNLAPWQSSTDSNSPLDAGTTPTPLSIPDRAKSALRTAVVAYAALVSGTPPDGGTAPIPSAVPDRAPRGQYRLANHASVTPTPVDAGLEPIGPEYPDRTWGVARLANYVQHTPAPRDAGLPSIGPEYPDLARGPTRSQYTITARAPLDIAVIQAPALAVMPDRAPTAMRARWQQTSTPTPRDVPVPSTGLLSPQQTGAGRTGGSLYQTTTAIVVAPSWPDRTRVAPRAAVAAYAALVSSAPRDIVIVQPIVGPTLPDVRGPRRAAQSAYQLTQGQLDPVDLLPDQFIPDRAPGWLRAANTAYVGLLAASPRDSGIAPIQPIVVAVLPDRAPGKLSAAQTSYISLVSATPRDAGTQPIFPIWPDRALAARRAALVPGSTPAPLDAGLSAIAPEYPDIAAGPRRSQYGILVRPPLEVQPIVAVAAPDRARGPARAASYQTGTQVPLDLPIPTALLPSLGLELPNFARMAPRAATSVYIALVSMTPVDQGIITVYQPLEQAVLAKLQSIFS